MNKLIILSVCLLFNTVLSDNINRSNVNSINRNKVNSINKDFSNMMNMRREKQKIEKNLTDSDYIIKHSYNNTKLINKKVSTKVQEYLAQIKENNNKIDNMMYNTYLKTKNKNIRDMYFRHKDRYKEKDL